MNQVEIAWAAGLLEGEAWFGTRTGYANPTITCEMTDIDVLERLQSLFGGNLNLQRQRADNWKQSARWAVNGQLAAQIMELVKEHLGKRRREKVDEILLAWYDRCERRFLECELRGNLRKQIYAMKDSGMTQVDVAAKTNVSPRLVRAIWGRESIYASV